MCENDVYAGSKQEENVNEALIIQVLPTHTKNLVLVQAREREYGNHHIVSIVV